MTWLRLLALVGLGWAGLSGAVWAQPAPTIGQGPGFHDPRSPFKPLQERAGVLTWQLLSAVTTKADKNRLLPIFPAAVQALDQQKVKVQHRVLPRCLPPPRRHHQW